MAFRLYHLSGYEASDPDQPSLTAGILTEACMDTAFILASVTCLRPFLRPFHRGYFLSTAGTKGSGYKSSVTGSHGNAYYMLSAAREAPDDQTPRQKTTTHDGVDEEEGAGHHQLASVPKAVISPARGVRVSHCQTETPEERAHGGSDGRRMTISKTKSWTVEYENGAQRDVCKAV